MNLAKNTMLTTFDGQRWYMQLYDCDSSTGLDNSGAMKFEPDIEVQVGVFNTSNSRLWTKLRNNFPNQILAEWETLRLSYFTEENIMKYINENISDKIPEINYNLDAWKKYITMGTEFLFACHGNRKQQFKRWIRERLIYMDTLLGYTVSTNDYITVRANKLGEVYFDIQTFQPMYFSIKFRNEENNTGVITKRIARGETVRFSYNLPVATDQEILVYGGRFIKDLGDLTNMNPTNLLLGNATRLTKVICHDSDMLINASISNCTMLQEVDLRGCKNLGAGSDASLQTLDLTQCRNLRKVDIFGTQLTALYTSQQGGIIQEIVYPYSIQIVQVKNQTRLTSLGIPCYYTGNVRDEANKYAEMLTLVDVANCPNVTTFVKNYCTNEDGTEISVPTFIGVSKCRTFNISNTMSYLTRVDLSHCSNIESLTLDNFYELKEINFDDISLWDATTSNLYNLTLTNCPNIETITFNQNTINGNNSLGVAFKEGTVLDLSGLFNLKNIRSNVGIKGLQKIILPSSIVSLVFDYPEDTTYSMGDSDIIDVFSKTANHDEDNYHGVDLIDINGITDFSIGSLTKINSAINLNIKITNTFPYFNYFKNDNYFKPEGIIDISDYTETLHYLFKGVDLDRLNIICNKPLPHTSAKHMFAFASCNNTEILNTLFSYMPNITDFSYMFYNGFLIEAPLIPLRAENVSYMFYNNTLMTKTPSNWSQAYPIVPNSEYCYTGCNNINMIDNESGSIDIIPSTWGGYDRSNITYSGEIIVAEKTMEREFVKFTATGQTFQNIVPEVGQTPTILANKSEQPICEGMASNIMVADGTMAQAELKGFTLVNLASEKRSGEFTCNKQENDIRNGLNNLFKIEDGGEFPHAILEGLSLTNILPSDGKTPIITNGGKQSHRIDNNLDSNIKIKDGKMLSATVYGKTLKNIVPKDATSPLYTNDYQQITNICNNDTNVILKDIGKITDATVYGKTEVTDGIMKSVKMPVLTTSNQDNILGKCSVSVRSAYGGYIKKLTDTTGEFKVTNSSQDVKIKFGGVNTIIGGDKWCYVTVRFGEDMSNVNFNMGNMGIGWTLLKDNRTLVFKGLTYGGGNIGDLVLTSSKGLVLNQLYTFEVIAIIPISSAWTFDDYVPYKTNILTINEDVTLRSNGSVYDELDLLTGKLTQRIDENGEVLSQEIVKTVDLSILDQDNNQQTELNYFKNGYISIDTETGIIPKLDYKVITNNCFEVSNLVANKSYTLRYNGTINSMTICGKTFTSPSNNSLITVENLQDNILLISDGSATDLMLIEGDVRNEECKYFENIVSIDGLNMNVLNNDGSLISSIQLPPHINLYSLPDGTRDEVDIKTGILTRKIGVNDDGSLYKLDVPITEKLILNYNHSCEYGRILPTGAMDYYNVVTSEYSQNISSILLDGADVWNEAVEKENTVRLLYVSPTDILMKASGGLYCDNDMFPNIQDDSDVEHCRVHDTENNKLYIYIDKNKLLSPDLVGFQIWLQDNQFTVYYETSETIVSIKDYSELDPELARWEMMDSNADGKIEYNGIIYPEISYTTQSVNRFEIDNLEPNTEYTIYAENMVENPTINLGGAIHNFVNGSPYTSGDNNVVVFNASPNVSNMMVIKGDTSNEVVPYFTGVNSVVNPKVQTPNRNIFDGELEKGFYGTGNGQPAGSNDRMRSKNYIEVKPNTTYTYSDGTNENVNILFYTDDKTFIKAVTTITFTTPQNAHYIRFYTVYDGTSDLTSYQIQIEEGSVATGYVPHGGSTVTTNLTLRSSESGIKDSYNIITGEYIRRVSEDLQELSNSIITTLEPQTLLAYENGKILLSSESGLLPTLIYAVPSTNTFRLPIIKTRTQYTLKYPSASGTITIGSLKYTINSDSMVFTTPLTINGDKSAIIFSDDNPQNVVLIEGNYSKREVPLFSGVKSVTNPKITVLNNTTGESVLYECTQNVDLRSLPNGVSDTLDIVNKKLTQVTGIRPFQNGDYELDNVWTDGNYTVYGLSSPIISNVEFETPVGYANSTIYLVSDYMIPVLNYRALSSNNFPLDLLLPNTTYTLYADTLVSGSYTLGGTHNGVFTGTEVISLGDITNNLLTFNGDLGLSNVMLIKGNSINSTFPFFRGLKSVMNYKLKVEGMNGELNELMIDDGVGLRACEDLVDSVDLMTCTLTRNLSELTLNGSENWIDITSSENVDENYCLFAITVAGVKSSSNVKLACDKFNHYYQSGALHDKEGIYTETNQIRLCVKKTTIGGDTVNAIKSWLQQNNTTVIYALQNSVIIPLENQWTTMPPTSYSNQTTITSEVVDSLKPVITITVATTTLEQIVSDLQTENLMTMMALTEMFEMSSASNTNTATTLSLRSDRMIIITPMATIYAKLIKKGLKSIDDVPESLIEQVKYLLRY